MTNGENPMILKKELAHTIVSELHGKNRADEAQQAFETTFQKKEGPSPDMITVFNTNKDTVDLVDVLAESGLCKSKSDARRTLNLRNTIVKVENDRIYKIGKKRFLIIKKNV